MKRVMMAVLMFGIASCAVESAPVATSTTDDDSAQTSGSELASPAQDREAAPHAIQCIDGTCESFSLCQANHGHIVGACGIAGTICCEL